MQPRGSGAVYLLVLHGICGNAGDNSKPGVGRETGSSFLFITCNSITIPLTDYLVLLYLQRCQSSSVSSAAVVSFADEELSDPDDVFFFLLDEDDEEDDDEDDEGFLRCSESVLLLPDDGFFPDSAPEPDSEPDLEDEPVTVSPFVLILIFAGLPSSPRVITRILPSLMSSIFTSFTDDRS